MENELDKNVNEDSETKENILQNENENVDETKTQNPKPKQSKCWFQ